MKRLTRFCGALCFMLKIERISAAQFTSLHNGVYIKLCDKKF